MHTKRVRGLLSQTCKSMGCETLKQIYVAYTSTKKKQFNAFYIQIKLMSDQITIYHIKCHLIRHSTYTHAHTHNNSLSFSSTILFARHSSNERTFVRVRARERTWMPACARPPPEAVAESLSTTFKSYFSSISIIRFPFFSTKIYCGVRISLSFVACVDETIALFQLSHRKSIILN